MEDDLSLTSLRRVSMHRVGLDDPEERLCRKLTERDTLILRSFQEAQAAQKRIEDTSRLSFNVIFGGVVLLVTAGILYLIRLVTGYS